MLCAAREQCKRRELTASTSPDCKDGPRGLSPVKAGGGSWEASPLAYRSLDSPNKTQKDCSLTSAKETAQPFHYSCTTSSMARGWLKAGDEYKQFILESLLNASE